MFSKIKNTFRKLKEKVLTFFTHTHKNKSTTQEVIDTTVSENVVELTHRDNGHHIWDEKDTILSLYFYRLKNKKSSPSTPIATRFSAHYTEISNEFKMNFNLSIKEFSEEIIGCTESALDVNSMVTEFYTDGVDTGRYHGNHYQMTVSHELEIKPLEELQELVNSIIVQIKNDKTRLSQNVDAKELRTLIDEIKSDDREYKSKVSQKKKQTKEELLRDLKRGKISLNSPSVHDIDIQPFEVREGAQIKHHKFGKGVLISSDGTFSEVEFDNIEETKKFPNERIAKFIVDDK